MIANRKAPARELRGSTMLRSFAGTCVGSVLAVAIARSASAEVTAAQVDEAIRTGVQYLLKRQDRATGNWTEYKGEPGGLTAMVTLALLNSGVPKDDPQVKAALDYLRKIGEPKQTYSTSLIIMAFCQADPAGYQLDRTSTRLNSSHLV